VKRKERPKKKPLRDISVNLAGVDFQAAVRAMLKTPPPKAGQKHATGEALPTVPPGGMPYAEYEKHLPKSVRDAINSMSKRLGKPLFVWNYDEYVASRC
jgi:hypothetical protein